MSTASVAPSPQKSASLKRPQADGATPTSTGAKSPDQSFKKARLNGDDSNGVKDIGKGGRWMVQKLEELERLYKAVVKAATVILQYQAFAIRLGKDADKLPVHLKRRINIAWGSFEASRRQVQAYMDESTQQASTPSSRQFAIPMPLPPANASLSVPVTGSTNLPLASPIPLSAATMLSFDHPPSGEPGAGQQPSDSARPDAKPFSFDMMQNTNPLGNGNGNGNSNGGIFDMQGMDISGANGMNELAAMLQQNAQDFTLDNLMGNINTQAEGPPNLAQQEITQQQSSTQNATVLDTSTGTNNETDQILAQLGALGAQDGGQVPNSGATAADDQPAVGMGDDDINALLASLGEGNADGQDFTNFDFSDNLDLTNLGEMAGLFNTSTTIEPEVPPDAQVKIEDAPPTTITQQSESGGQQAPIDLTATDPAPPTIAPPTESKKEESQTQTDIDIPDFSGIDMDDFNFGEGDEAQEGMGMSGDEFDRLLAGAFND